MVQFPDPPEAVSEVCRLAAGQGGEGGLDRGRAHARPHLTHEIDGLVAQPRPAAIARVTQRACQQMVFVPAVLPVGQGSRRQAELLGG